MILFIANIVYAPLKLFNDKDTKIENDICKRFHVPHKPTAMDGRVSSSAPSLFIRMKITKKSNNSLAVAWNWR